MKGILDKMRDKCWLGKQVDRAFFNSFQIDSKDLISNTIIKEMPILFKEIEKVSQNAAILFQLIQDDSLGEEGFNIKRCESTIIQANTSKGLLYGMYRLYEEILLGNQFEEIVSIPDQSIRMINHWDNIDGTIERGYAGESIFYANNQFRRDWTIVHEYARLLASIGINALSINNVNVHKVETRLITMDFIEDLKTMNAIFSSYGIKLFLSINFASPITIGRLETADPLDERVQNFWQKIVSNLYKEIPTFGGFVVKADSEGEPGPFAYGRGHDDGANMFAEILKPFGGICIWRCFVYNCKQDWRDRSIDRARAAYDHFMPLDGRFSDNVILQIKLGSLDFQVKEPVSPLFGGLRKTNQIIEFQLTQEYTGQQRAVYYQAPVWKEALDFDTKHDYSPSVVKGLLKSNSIDSKNSGICAVGVVGMDENWTHHKLMQSNIYAYGKLCWDNQLTSEEMANNWSKLSFILSDQDHKTVSEILITSRETYRLYNAPNGVGFMCKPHIHYGPDVDGYEYDRWGTYHFADRNGIGNNRSKTGTKYVEQYSSQRCEEYHNVKTCPDDLLLWFHYVKYDHKLQNGKTLIQDIYDNHFEGVERVQKYIAQWKTLENEIDEESYSNVSGLLDEQYDMAIEWRDQINTYFFRKSGISDKYNRNIYH